MNRPPMIVIFGPPPAVRMGPPAFLQVLRAGVWVSVSRFPGGSLQKARRWFEVAVAKQYPRDMVQDGVTVAGEMPELRMITPFAASPVPRAVIRQAFENQQQEKRKRA